MGLVVVLTFALGCGAEVDGVLGAAVVTAHAVGAMAVPSGAAILYCDVLQRAVLGADAASYAIIGYTKLAVGYEQGVEEGFEDV